MDIFIARDGVELGECEEADLPQLAREGQLQPTDYYWREGMETWLPLTDLLPSNTWNTPPARIAPRARAAEPRRKAPAPVSPALATTQRIDVEEGPRAAASTRFQLSRNARLVAAIACIVLVIGGIVFRLASARGARQAGPTSFFPAVQEKTGPSDDQIKDKAVAELRARINALPAKPAPPLHIFYYGVSVDMRRSISTRAPWMAVIRGGENVVDPAADKTLMHTDFILTVEFRDGAWCFQHYTASVSDMVKEQTTEIDDDPHAPTPPSIVGMLGLKMPD